MALNPALRLRRAARIIVLDREGRALLFRFDVPDRDSLQGSISERAERVLRELRKRLGEFERPREELEYLERLLRQR